MIATTSTVGGKLRHTMLALTTLWYCPLGAGRVKTRRDALPVRHEHPLGASARAGHHDPVASIVAGDTRAVEDVALPARAPFLTGR
jgi:hypothetical protein